MTLTHDPATDGCKGLERQGQKLEPRAGGPRGALQQESRAQVYHRSVRTEEGESHQTRATRSGHGERCIVTTCIFRFWFYFCCCNDHIPKGLCPPPRDILLELHSILRFSRSIEPCAVTETVCNLHHPIWHLCVSTEVLETWLARWRNGI